MFNYIYMYIANLNYVLCFDIAGIKYIDQTERCLELCYECYGLRSDNDNTFPTIEDSNPTVPIFML